MNESVKICPIDTGRLRASRKVAISKDSKNVNLELSYNTEYALKVHEDLEAYHRPPTRAKFLEIPVREALPELKENLEKRIEKVIMKMLEG